jgi:uncharacterized membrane protein
MNKRTLRWVDRELPELVSQGVLPPDVAERIRLYYSDQDASANTAKRWAVILFSVLGALLIGGGIILLLAHNWEALSRPTRAVISIVPLAVSAILGGWLLWTKRSSIAWREGVGTAQTLAIGSSIALVSQTYNLGGRFDEFMWTWSLLALPIAYLLGATFPMLLYLVGILFWTGSVITHGSQPLWYFLLLGLALPFIWHSGKTNRYHPRPVLLGWVLAITVCIGSGMALGKVCDQLKAWPVLYGGLFALLFLIGARWWGEATATWHRPFQNIGSLTAVGLCLVLSFKDPWGQGHWDLFLAGMSTWLIALKLALAALFPVVASILWVQSWARRAWHEIMLGSIPVLAFLGWICTLEKAAPLAAALFNLFLIAYSIGTLVIGLRGQRLGVVNAGMLMLAAVILCRFFDADLGFVLRGVAFIAIGLGFLATNLVLLRKKGAVQS